MKRVGIIAAAILSAGVVFAQSSDTSTPSLSRTFDELKWRKQAPDLPIMISELWGNRERDGGFGELVQVPAGFDSGLHAHSGDFHGVLVKGTWIHVDENGGGTNTPLAPGSYIRQAGRGLHVDKCVSKEPCVLFLFQYARADVLWPKDVAAAPSSSQMEVKSAQAMQYKVEYPDEASSPQISIVSGDVATTPISMFIRMKKSTLPMHSHSADYQATVIRGTMKHWAKGESEAAAPRLGPGSWWYQPGGQVHTDACLDNECLLYVHNAGKLDTIPDKP